MPVTSRSDGLRKSVVLFILLFSTSSADETEEDLMLVNVNCIRPLLAKNRKRKADTSPDVARSSSLATSTHSSSDSKTPRSAVTSPYLIPEVAYVISVCDDRIPFIALQEELNRHKIRHQVGQVTVNRYFPHCQ